MGRPASLVRVSDWSTGVCRTTPATRRPASLMSSRPTSGRSAAAGPCSAARERMQRPYTSGPAWTPPLAVAGADGSAVGRPEGRARVALFEVEQPALAVEPAAVAGEGAGGADDPVAGKDDRERVAAVRQADGAAGARPAEPGGDAAVAGGVAVGDLGQQLPDAPLEVAAANRHAKVEDGALAGEVRLELLRRVRQRRPVGDPVGPDPLGVALAQVELDPEERAAVADQQQLPDGAVDHRVAAAGAMLEIDEAHADGGRARREGAGPHEARSLATGPGTVGAASSTAEGCAVAGRQPAGDGAGGGDGDLLAEHGADGELVRVDVAGDAPAGARGDQRCEQPVLTENVRHRQRVGVEVEQPPAAPHRVVEVALVLQAQATADLARLPRSLQRDHAAAVRQGECPGVDAVGALLDAGDGAGCEEAQQRLEVQRRPVRQ